MSFVPFFLNFSFSFKWTRGESDGNVKISSFFFYFNSHAAIQMRQEWGPVDRVADAGSKEKSENLLKIVVDVGNLSSKEKKY